MTMSFFVCVCLGFSLGYEDEAVDSLLPLKEKLENPDHSVLYKTCADLTKVSVICTTQQGTKIKLRHCDALI